MRIIDRYLLRQFAQTFVICFLSLVGLFVVFDLFTNLETFVIAGRKAGGFVPFIGRYYMFQTILFFDRTGGLLALVSAMFTIAWIQRHNEMTALLAAGVSRFRVLLPIILAVAVVSIVLAANREILMPRYRHELSRRSQDPGGDKPQSIGSRYDGRTNVMLGGRNSFADQQRIEEPNFRMPTSLYDYGSVLTADNAYYKPPDGADPGGYLFVGVRRAKEPRHRDGRCRCTASECSSPLAMNRNGSSRMNASWRATWISMN